MNTIIVHSENKLKEKAIKSFLEALNVEYEDLGEQTDVLPDDVIAGIKLGQEQFLKGQTKTYSELKDMLANRWK